jgi:hypothetical protein
VDPLKALFGRLHLCLECFPLVREGCFIVKVMSAPTTSGPRGSAGALLLAVDDGIAAGMDLRESLSAALHPVYSWGIALSCLWWWFSQELGRHLLQHPAHLVFTFLAVTATLCTSCGSDLLLGDLYYAGFCDRSLLT